MKTDIRALRNIIITRRRRNPLRLTALLYLREALQSENYETCNEIIAYARRFGATVRQIKNLLEDPRRVPT